MAPRRGVKPDAENSEPPIAPAGHGLDELLLGKSMEQFDIPSLASKLAPELANRLLGRVSIDALADRALDLAASKVAEDPALIDAVFNQILAQMKV